MTRHLKPATQEGEEAYVGNVAFNCHSGNNLVIFSSNPSPRHLCTPTAYASSKKDDEAYDWPNTNGDEAVQIKMTSRDHRLRDERQEPRGH